MLKHHYNYPIEQLFPQRRKQSGEVGIEIECEGSRLPRDIEKWWAPHADGSLRGESMEYVLAQPIKRDNVRPALDFLSEEFRRNETKLRDSQRTSVHVHLNMQGLSMKQVLNHVCLYMVFEDLLVEFSGRDRVGNLFCLRAVDAEYMVRELRKAVRSNDFHRIGQENLRYAACNVTALQKYGSLEFRSFRGTSDFQLIDQWTAMLLRLKDAARKYTNPSEIAAEFSGMGPDAFLASVFDGEPLAILRRMENYTERMYTGMRLAQDLMFATDWVHEEYVPKEKATAKKKAAANPEFGDEFVVDEMVDDAPVEAPRRRGAADLDFAERVAAQARAMREAAEHQAILRGEPRNPVPPAAWAFRHFGEPVVAQPRNPENGDF